MVVIHISHYPESRLAEEAKPIIAKLNVDRIIFAEDDFQATREKMFEAENGDEPNKLTIAKQLAFSYYKELINSTDDNQTTVIFGPFYYNGKLCALEKNKKVILRIFLSEDFFEYAKNYYDDIMRRIKKNPNYVDAVYKQEFPNIIGTAELIDIYATFKSLHKKDCYTTLKITGLKSFVEKSEQYKLIQKEREDANEKSKSEKDSEKKSKKIVKKVKD